MGAAIMSLGYLSLFYSPPATITWSLAVLIVGNGLFKPNVGSLLGLLYEKDDPRRESGFTIFYLGINNGAFVATLIADWIGQTFGYDIAGVGKLISLITFLIGRRWLDGKGYAPHPNLLEVRHLGFINPTGLVLIGGVGVALLTAVLVRHEALAGDLLAVAGLIAFGYLLFETFREEGETRRRLIAMIVLTASSIVFWTAYNQVGTSFILFTERLVDRTTFGITQPASEFLSVNPLFILLMGGPFAALWAWFSKRGWNPSMPIKFVLGHLLIAAAFFSLVLAILASPGMAPWEWLVLFFALYTATEMTLSPVGLAVVTALAPTRLLGLSMGLWLLATSVSFYLAGLAAGIAAVPDSATDAESESIYRTAFTDYGWIGLGGS